MATESSAATMTVAGTHRGDARYAVSGFGNRLGWGARPALLLIDVCAAYWTPGSPLDVHAHAPSVAAPAVMRRLVAAARTSGVPVIWTAVEYAAELGMRDAGIFWHKTKSLNIWQVGDPRGLHAWLGDGLEPEAGETVVKKKYPSGFFGTTLATELQVRGVDTVVICGVSTSGCVRATTLDAMQYGFRPMVVGSACGDRSEEIHSGNLFDMNAKYADVVDEEEAIAHLTKGWPAEAN
ncbi:hypothetical protein HK405_009504 [Cladochytrium tenue]|nr:hypothetical protein HK405_009504 [Cladochytrium tenue]